jgi:quercetin dioxygenase-like cupin family protein
MDEIANGPSMHVPSGAGTSYWMIGGERATIKVTSGETYGAYAVVEVTTPPLSGPPPHIHHTMEEAFYLLEGEMEFVTDGIATTATVGSLVRIPKGVCGATALSGPHPQRRSCSSSQAVSKSSWRKWDSRLPTHRLRKEGRQIWRSSWRPLRSMDVRYHRRPRGDEVAALRSAQGSIAKGEPR